MLVNNNGKAVGNMGTPAVEFATPEAYQNWKDNLPTGVSESDFIVILDYIPEVGSYFQTDTKEELEALPSVMKLEGVLYGVTALKQLFYYDKAASKFEKYGV